MRSVPRALSGTTVVFFVAMCTCVGTIAARAHQDAQTLVGRLATVEPAKRRVTMVPEGEVDLVEMFVAEDGEVAHEERALTLADLVIQVGQRVAVVYRLEGDRRIVARIIVEPD
jgi:hypothetical protein